MTDNDPLTDGPLPAALARDDAVWAREHLERDVVAWLTTVAPDGRVQSSLISFLHDGADVFLYSQPNTPKLRNLAHSPLVSFHLQSYPYGDNLNWDRVVEDLAPGIVGSLHTHQVRS